MASLLSHVAAKKTCLSGYRIMITTGYTWRRDERERLINRTEETSFSTIQHNALADKHLD